MADTDTEMVRIYHPGTKGESVQPRSSLGVWYRSGWLLVEENQEAPAEAEPEPISAAEVAAALEPDPADTKAAASKTASSKPAKEQ